MKKKQGSVLIIEEEERFIDLYKKTLKDEGFIPIIVNSMSKFEEINSLKPDLIVVDIYGFGKPKMELLKSVRKIHPNKPIIVISSLNSVDDCITSYKLGARYFIQKSVNTFPLIASIKNISLDSLVL